MKRKLQLLILALLAGTAFAAKDNITLDETPCGLCTDYPTLADWVAAAMGTFQWETVPNLSVSTGATGSRNDRALVLSASGSPVISIACTPTLAGGFTLGANGPTWAGTTAYSGVCRETATLGILAARSNKFRVEAIAPPSNDLTAPTTPTGLTTTAGAGQVVLEWDAASDPYVGEAGSGIGSYRVRVNGATLITGIGASAGLSKQLTTYNIGAGSGTHTCSQSGANWTVVGAGTGIDGAADGFAGCLAQVVGPFCVSTTVTALDAPATYNKAFLEIQSSSDTNSIAYSPTVLLVGSTYSVQIRARTTVGGNRTTLVNEALASLPVTLKACKDASNTLTFYRSADGNAFTQQLSTASGMGDTALIGLGATATSAGVAATAQFNNFSITNSPRVSYTHLNTSGAPTTYEVSAIDVAGNVGAYSPTSTATPTAPVDTTPPTRTVQPSGSANGSSSSINWDLGTCTDNVAISGYSASLFAGAACGGSALATIAQQSSSAASNTGLTASTTYSLISQCYDTAGNQAIAQSNCVSATTAAGSNNPAAAPATVTVTPTGTAAPTTTLRVSWSAVQYADHYRVRYKLSSASSYTLLPTNYTTLTVDITGLAVNTAYDVQVSANNALDSVSFGFESGATVYHGTTQGLSSAAIKWHPGYYMKILRGTAEQSQSYRFSMYDSIASNANVKGVTWSPRWGNLETSQGVYDFSSITAELNKLKNIAVPKRLILRMETSGGYGNTSTQSVSKKVWPQYILDQGCLFEGISGSSTKPNFKFWRSDCMDRFIALYQAMGAALDSDAYLEAVTLMYETAQQLNVSTSVSEFSASAYDTQMRRLYVAAKAAFPHTNLNNNVNYLTGMSEAASIPHYDYMYSVGVGYSDADGCADCNIYGDRIIRGAASGSTDRRGATMIAVGAETSEMGCNYVGPTGGYTATQLATWSNATMHSSHIEWDNNEVCGTPDQKWSTGLLPYINAHPTPTYTGCPTIYANGCNTN